MSFENEFYDENFRKLLTTSTSHSAGAPVCHAEWSSCVLEPPPTPLTQQSIMEISSQLYIQ